MGIPLVEMRGVTKRFSGVTANRNVNFSVEAGEVHGLLGENGAGKSTLMNILYGLYRPDEGEIFVNGERQVFRSPGDAIAAGIGMVHQNFMLAPAQTVWENVILGMKEEGFFLSRKKIQGRVEEISERYGLKIDPSVAVWQLSTGERQRVALLRALYRGARVLVLDEPTAVLTPQESEGLFRTLRRMTEEGHGVVFISHKMREVMSETRRVTVLRGGENAGAVLTARTTEAALAEMMMGQKAPSGLRRGAARAGAVVFEVRHLRVLDDRDLEVVRGVSFHLREGEIFGVAGVAGNGQKELCEALTGLRTPLSGSVVMGGEELTGASPRRFIDRGARYVPADRKSVGMAPSMDVRANSILRKYWRDPVAKGPFINWKEAEVHARRIVEEFGVLAPSLRAPVKNLSGGNLQKLLMGRELSDNPKVLVVMHPTWGLDVSATRYVRQRLLERRENGAAVFLVSEDLDELLTLSDRLAVLFKGQFMEVLSDPVSVPVETIGLLMAGSAPKDGRPFRVKSFDIPIHGVNDDACPTLRVFNDGKSYLLRFPDRGVTEEMITRDMAAFIGVEVFREGRDRFVITDSGYSVIVKTLEWLNKKTRCIDKSDKMMVIKAFLNCGDYCDEAFRQYERYGSPFGLYHPGGFPYQDFLFKEFPEEFLMWIDHREEDEAIVRYCEDILRTGSLVVEINDTDDALGFEFIILYKGKKHKVPYRGGKADRDTTITALNEVLIPDYEIRFCKHSDGGDTLAFLPLPAEQWRELENEFGQEEIDYCFSKIAAQTGPFSRA
ncbi:MAG: ABC transporter ATP-binding protein [Synergistaceae bacterium]|jgi:simple sugar transport system ATP-binding protein|nr:ABC transporter ATP-binding protein [Synergistaceae bacterium]